MKPVHTAFTALVAFGLGVLVGLEIGERHYQPRLRAALDTLNELTSRLDTPCESPILRQSRGGVRE